MEFATRFDPKECEDRIYKMWEEKGCFRADATSTKEPFTIVIPPPNVTGALHLGHALNNTLQDTLTRFKRLSGYEALWLPGTDHAGIATQAKVVDKLKKEGKSIWDMGRDAFIKAVWEWKEEYGNTILYQLRRLGSSCDWSRTRFTMDEKYSKAVRTVFVSLFKKNLIYRGQYIVNWCPECRTALSDLEVENKPVKGKLWTFRYPVEGGKQISVSTTRPETIMGDVAVAVNPKDERYKDFVGKKAKLPILGREIEIVADPMVDPEFGTGAVKITPAHDFNDFQVAQRLKLNAIQVIDEGAKMNANAGPFKGQDRFTCRKNIIAEFEKLGFYDGEKDYDLVLGHCYRTQTPVEPYLSEQWFVRMEALAKPAIEAVKNGDVKFHPDRWSKIYFDWMENIRDWCVSRQIWWGHRIPVWYCACGEAISAVEDPTECPKCGGKEIKQDNDVLDTWFSSALWPFATLGWPEETEDLEKFFPTSVLVTDRGIINLWVARMIMSGLEFRGENPFSDVVIHATLMDDQGKRQSKSLGTGVDPLEKLDEFGADPLRFAIAWLCTGTQDIRFGNKLSDQRVDMSRRFVTKIWNACRFVQQKLEAGKPGEPGDHYQDRWIRSRCNAAVEEVTAALERFDFGGAAQKLYSFIWDEFCDWYVELSKDRPDDPGTLGTLRAVISDILCLLHPIMPFVTEEIWHKMGFEGILMTSDWPDGGERDRELEARFEMYVSAVRGIREKRNQNEIPPKEKVSVILSARDEASASLLKEGADLIRSQGIVDGLEIGVGLDKPKAALTFARESFVGYLPLAEGDLKKERERTEKRITDITKQLKQKRGQLANERFVQAKPDLAEKAREKVTELEASLKELSAHLKELGDE